MRPTVTSRPSCARATRTSFAFAGARNHCSGDRLGGCGDSAHNREAPILRLAEPGRGEEKARAALKDAGSDHPAGLVVPSIGGSSLVRKVHAREYQIGPDFDLIVRARPS
jgi:hypothetical protein